MVRETGHPAYERTKEFTLDGGIAAGPILDLVLIRIEFRKTELKMVAGLLKFPLSIQHSEPIDTRLLKGHQVPPPVTVVVSTWAAGK
jgi:hypothetical protein